eukprot:gene10182-biopygen18271
MNQSMLLKTPPKNQCSARWRQWRRTAARGSGEPLLLRRRVARVVYIGWGGTMVQRPALAKIDRDKH